MPLRDLEHFNAMPGLGLAHTFCLNCRLIFLTILRMLGRQVSSLQVSLSLLILAFLCLLASAALAGSPPALSDISNQRTFHSTPTRPIPFTVASTDLFTLSAASTNTALVPATNIILIGSGSNWTVAAIPVTNLLGTTSISISASNQFGTATKSFFLTVGDFSDVGSNLPNAYFGTVNWVDYDNDGYLDLFMSGYDTNDAPHTWLFHNNHDGTFSEVATPFPNWAETSADWADFDGDGYADLVMKGTTGNGYYLAQVFHNLGGTNFEYVTSLNAYYGGGSVAWCDLDNDGKPDILCSTFNATWVYHNNGDGTFTNITQLPGGTVATADYDHDGFNDIFILGDIVNGFPTKLWHNTGTNAFTDSGMSFGSFYEGMGFWGDYNNDGWPDLLLSAGSDSGDGVNVLFGNSSGILTNVNASFAPLRDGTAAWGDFDNDGNLDFFSFGLVIGCCYQSKIYHNAGTNNAFNDFGFAMPGVSMGAAAWGDYDNDGALDLVFMGRNSSSGLVTKLYHNDGAMPARPPTTPTGLSASRGPNSAILSWTASTDPDQSGGLTYNVRMGTSNGAINIVSPLSDLATGFLRVPKIGNAGYRTSLLITNLPAGTYYWSVQAVDNAFKGSLFAPEQSFSLAAPEITNQPQSLTVLAGSQVVFQVGASGAPPLVFQWSLNGTNLAGATDSTLTLINVQHADSGTYAVTVSNMWGSITSSNALLTVNTPPIILAQPQSVTAIEGQSASFFVFATGDAPLSYQWSFNGTNLAGATNATLNLTAVVPSQAGLYSVLITNLSGSTNSDAATLSTPPSLPLILAQPQSQYVPAGLGVNANFSVAVIGTTPFSYQWRFTGTNIAGATQPFFTITNVQITDAGAYSVLITNSVGPSLSQDAILSVTSAPTSTTNFIPFSSPVDFVYDDVRDILYIVNGGNNVQRYQLGSAGFLTPFTISGSLANLDLSPDGNLLAIADYTSSTNAWLDLVGLNSSTVGQAILTNFSGYVYSLAFGNDGAVVCQVGNLVLRYDPLTGLTTRQNTVDTSPGPMTASGDRSTIAIAGPGDSAGLVFTYNVAGRGIDGFIWSNDYISAPPEISRDGSVLAEPTRYGLPIFTNLHTRDYSGNYIALIGGPSGVVFSPNQDLLFCGGSGTGELHAYETANFTESFVLDFGTNITSSRMRMSRDGSKIFGAVSGGIQWMNWTNIGPSFLTQPTNQICFAGSNVTFATHVFGSPAMEYQWQVEGISIPNATNATYLLPGQPFHTGPSNYSVIAYNPFGYVISTNALLTIVSPPFFTMQPQSQTIGAGSNVTFSVAADGSAPLGYQWQANGTNIPGATNVILSFTNVQASLASNYVVVLSNIYGSATSAVATLTVMPMPPWLALEPVDQTTYVSSNVAFFVKGLGSVPLSYQWFTNATTLADGGRISGASTPNLNISNVQPGDAGRYYAVVSNSYGAITSSVAALSVMIIPPSITLNPLGRSVPPGLPTSFTAAASGSPPVQYQWQLNGVDIPNATSSIYSISAVGTNDLGSYHLVATNFSGVSTATSTAALLTFGNVAAWGRNASNECLPPPDLTNAFAVAGSLGASFAACTDGSLVAWGAGSATNVPASATNVVALSAGGGAIGLRADGTLVGWNGIAVPNASNIVAVAEGNNFGFGLRAEGTLVAWGNSAYTNFPAGLNHVTAIACGTTHALALRSDGSLVSWGTGSATNIPALSGNITAIAAGNNFSLALKSDGTVAAWGSGIGSSLPAGLTNVAAIFAGGDAQGQGAAWGQAIRSNGTLVAWGSNGYGETTPPAGLSNLVSATAAPASYHGLDVICDGRPLILHPPVGLSAYVGRDVRLEGVAAGAQPLSYQWLLNGTNLPGATNAVLCLSNIQLSDTGNYQLTITNTLGVATSRAAPLAVLNDNTLAFLSQPAGQTNYQGSTAFFGATVQGNGPLSYQWYFSPGNTGYLAVPGATNDVLKLDPLLALQSGNYHVAVHNQFLSITSSPVSLRVIFARAWGFNVTISNPPVVMTNAIAVATGGYGDYSGHYLALGSDGQLTSWADYSPSYGETNVSGLSNVVAIAAGNQDSLVLRSDSSVYGFGYNGFGETNSPPGLLNVVGIACGDYHDLALLNDGTVVGWGQNTYGQIGTNSAATNAVAIAAGSLHSVALRADGTVVAWGQNSAGQTTIPAGATNVIALAAGAQFTAALRANGTVLQWGAGLGNSPVPAGLSNVVAISGSYSHVTALRCDGTVVSWGYDYRGSASGYVPSDLTNVIAITSGGDHDFGLLGTRAPAFTIQPWNHLVPRGTTNILLAAKVVGLQPVTYQWIFNDADVPGATNDTLSITNLQLTQSGSYQLLASNSYDAVLSKLVSVIATVPFSEALEASNITWSSTNSIPWFGQPNVTHGDTTAAQSGSIGHNQETTLQSSLTGPGQLSFWWKVSSQTNTDTLQFKINGVVEATISGEVDWQQLTFYLGSGTNLLQWRYSKGATGAAGQDAGWLDQVAYLTNPPPVILANDASFGFRSNNFSFNTRAVPGQIVVIEATTDFTTWTAIQTNVATGGAGIQPANSALVSFTDPQSWLHRYRFYRARLFQGVLPPPTILTAGAFGFQSNLFGFDLSAISGQNLVIEASTNLSAWMPLATNVVTSVPFYFSDPATNLSRRFYRARVQ